MSTVIMTKKRLIDWLTHQVDENAVVLVSQDLSGHTEVKPKLNAHRVSFDFAADCFIREGDIGHFAFGRTPVFAVTICEEKDVSKDTFEKFKTL